MVDGVLERRCRALLVAYPAEYRARRGDEIVGTLLEAAGPHRRTPRVADAADVLAGGMRCRLAVGTITGLEPGLVIAAPVALALAAGIAMFAWVWVEPVSSGAYMGGPALLGQFRTLGPIAYAAWILAVLARATLPTPTARGLVAVAIAVTFTVPVVAPLTTVDRPPLWVLAALVMFGVLALAGTSGSAGAPARPSAEERLGVVLGAIAVALGAHAVVVAWPPSGSGFGYYYQPTIARVGAVAALAVGAVATVAVLRHLRGRGGRDWLWAAALLGLPAGWLGPFDSAGLRVAADGSVPHFGRLAQILLASCVAAAAIGWLVGQHRPDRPKPTEPATELAAAGALALGSAVGLALFLALAGLGVVGFDGTPVRAGAPGHVLAAVAVLLVAGVVGLAPGRGAWTETRRERSDRSEGRHRIRLRGPVRAAASTSVIAWLVAAYDNGWTMTGWTDYPHTASLVATLALLPLGVCAVIAARVGRRPEAAGGVRVAAATLVVLGGGWVGYASIPHVLSWGPVLLVLLACGAVVAISGRASAAA
jgi:hypothetical protein